MKHALLKFVPLVIATLFFCSCANETTKTETATTAAFSLDSAKAAIAVSNQAFSASFVSGDSVAFANCYTSDACIYVTGMPKMCGTPAIKGFFDFGYKMGVRGLTLTTDEVMGGKEGVIETGSYEMFMANNVSADKGKYMVLWKEEHGKWKMFRDIWNSDLPAPAPPPTATK